jgi:hypothetical protein
MVKKVSIFGFAIVSAFLILSMITVAQPMQADSTMKIIDSNVAESSQVNTIVNKVKSNSALKYKINKLASKSSVKQIVNKLTLTSSESDRLKYLTQLGNTLESTQEYKAILNQVDSMFGSDLSAQANSNNDQPAWFPGFLLVLLFFFIVDTIIVIAGWILVIIGEIIGAIITGFWVVLAIIWTILDAIFGGGGNSLTTSIQNTATSTSVQQQAAIRAI